MRRQSNALLRVVFGLTCLAIVVFCYNGPAWAETSTPASESITHREFTWPTWKQWRRVLSLQDYNTRVVLFGAGLLGIAAGTIGSFTLLRKRALMGDALSHATLPGICLAYVVVTAAGGEGKSLPVLLFGAATTGILGVGAILFIRRYSLIKEDSALGIVLSVFFGAGTALLVVANQTEGGSSAGLETFIYGKTASMLPSDAYLIAHVSLVVAIFCSVLFKPFKVLCFDSPYGASLGLRTLLLDMLMMALVVLVTIVGLQAVGLILMIALLVIPAAAARFWTEGMSRMTVISAVLGGISALIGAGMSALLPNLPSGAMVVLVAALFFLVSLVFGSARGVLIRAVRRHRLNAKIHMQHLLRGMYERLESRGEIPPPQEASALPAVALDELLAMRSWNRAQLRRTLRRIKARDWIEATDDGGYRLTATGYQESARLVRRHRLWELYLITHADIAPSHVDRDADLIEHVLDKELLHKLERLLAEQTAAAPLESPHPIAAGEAAE